MAEWQNKDQGVRASFSRAREHFREIAATLPPKHEKCPVYGQITGGGKVKLQPSGGSKWAVIHFL